MPVCSGVVILVVAFVLVPTHGTMGNFTTSESLRPLPTNRSTSQATPAGLVTNTAAIPFTRKSTYTLGFLLPYKFINIKDFPGIYRAEMYAQAILIALRDVRRKNLLTSANLTYVMNRTSCEELQAIKGQFWQNNHGVDAFFGPGCHCVTVARNAAAFNKPLMSFVSISFKHVSRMKYLDPESTPELLYYLEMC